MDLLSVSDTNQVGTYMVPRARTEEYLGRQRISTAQMSSIAALSKERKNNNSQNKPKWTDEKYYYEGRWKRDVI